MKILIKEL